MTKFIYSSDPPEELPPPEEPPPEELPPPEEPPPEELPPPEESPVSIELLEEELESSESLESISADE